MQLQRIDLGHGAWVAHVEDFVPDHARLMQTLVQTLPLRQEPLVLFGKQRSTPRLTSWHGDAHCHYRYSGRTFAPTPWTPELAALRDRLRASTHYPFNCVLANYYRDGTDSMGAHRDNEPELGPHPDDVAVASVSLGARRRFCLRAINGDAKRTFELGEGDLLLMGGTTQQHFEHFVAKTKRPVGPRLNLTFRVLRIRDAL